MICTTLSTVLRTCVSAYQLFKIGTHCVPAYQVFEITYNSETNDKESEDHFAKKVGRCGGLNECFFLLKTFLPKQRPEITLASEYQSLATSRERDRPESMQYCAMPSKLVAISSVSVTHRNLQSSLPVVQLVVCHA